MGYTHYWTQLCDIAPDEFEAVVADILAILHAAEASHGVAICDGAATPRTRPEVSADRLAFNGTDIGDQGHETFELLRVRQPHPYLGMDRFGWDFCKTARKPYDIAVTAALCYLSTVAESHHVSSDGHGRDFLAGLALAREALPQHANRLDIPHAVLAADRWCPPFVHLQTESYAVRFCVDGHAYVLDRSETSLFRFASHVEAAQWLASHKEPGGEGDALLFDAYGSFSECRRAALARAQDRALGELIAQARSAPPGLGRQLQPPPLVRPDERPLTEAPASLSDLLARAEDAPGEA